MAERGKITKDKWQPQKYWLLSLNYPLNIMMSWEIAWPKSSNMCLFMILETNLILIVI